MKKVLPARYEDGVLIPQQEVTFTAEEEAVLQAEWDLAESNRALEEWELAMKQSDALLLPRYMEDLLDGLGTNNLPIILVDNYLAKKTLRSEKPE